MMKSPRADGSRRCIPKVCTRFTVVVPLLVIGGCSVGPTYVRPAVDVPGGWRGHVADQVSVQAQNESLWPGADWWQGFRSPQLSALITQAKAGNLDLAAATARVREADAQARVAGAALLPSVGVNGGISHTHAGASSGSGTRAGTSSTLYDAELSASYELDFWGGNHAAVRAAKQQALASRYSAEVVDLTAIASVATTYFQIIELRDQTATLSRNIDSAHATLAALQAQESAGIATALDVAQQRTAVLTMEAELPPLREKLRQYTDALAILIGKSPGDVDLPAGSLSDLSHPVVAPGLPSALLARRPDVAMAEAQLKAANANIGVARAAFFPNIQLTAQGGFESTALSSLFGPAGVLYSLAASVSQPIFEGGTLQGKYQYAQAYNDELVADYRKSVISAFQDVEDSLIACQQTADEETRQEAAVDAARQAYDVAIAQLRAGTANVLTVLGTESALFTAETTLLQVRLARLDAIVSLFKALGGGWKQGDDIA